MTLTYKIRKCEKKKLFTVTVSQNHVQDNSETPIEGVETGDTLQVHCV
jgi:hypothetical protein